MSDIDKMELPQRVPSPAVGFTRGKRSGDTVYVACKIPHGLILRVFEPEVVAELQRDGSSKDVKRWIPVPEAQFVIQGPWFASAGQAYNKNNGAVVQLLPGGYAITEGCPKDTWDKWYEQNKGTPLVKNGIIFAHKERQSVVDEARKRAKVESGLEPIDPANPGAKMGGIDRRLKISVLDTGEGTAPRDR
jgi:hypothetical protein